jgi:hypothetical protein
MLALYDPLWDKLVSAAERTARALIWLRRFAGRSIAANATRKARRRNRCWNWPIRFGIN